jgi:hypothetical protein
MLDNLGIWLAVILTLCIGSILWRHNRFYRVAEHILVGFTAGHLVVVNYFNVVRFGIEPMIEQGMWVNSIPIIIGLLFYARFFKRANWLIRIPLAYFFGFSGAIGITGMLDASIRRQIYATVLPLWDSSITPVWGFIPKININSIIIIFGTITTLVYFFMTKRHRGITGGLARVGRVFIMVTLGARFGTVVMSRLSLLIDRLYFLLHDWLHLL